MSVADRTVRTHMNHTHNACKGRIMFRLVILGIGILAVAACNTVPYDPERFRPVASNVGRYPAELIEERSRAIAGDLGVTVQSVYVQPIATRQQRDDNSDRLSDGYVAWLKIAECDQGHLVVKSDDFAVPTQAFTRFGCTLEGLPSY